MRRATFSLCMLLGGEPERSGFLSERCQGRVHPQSLLLSLPPSVLFFFPLLCTLAIAHHTSSPGKDGSPLLFIQSSSQHLSPSWFPLWRKCPWKRNILQPFRGHYRIITYVVPNKWWLCCTFQTGNFRFMLTGSLSCIRLQRISPGLCSITPELQQGIAPAQTFHLALLILCDAFNLC